MNNKNLIRSGTLEAIIMFLLVPLMSIPSVLYQIRKGDKISSVLFCAIIGVLGYLYIPSVTDDKARYYEMYELYKTYNYSQFLNHLEYYKVPDFIYDFTVFIFSSLGIRFESMFFIFTFMAVFVYTRILYSILEHGKYTKDYFLLASLLGFISFTFLGLFSGIRFTMSSSFLMLAIYYFFFKKKNLIGFVYLIISIEIHFAMLFFLPLIIIVKFTNVKLDFLRIIFFISLVFLIYPNNSVFINILETIGFQGGLQNKVNGYTENEDFISQNFSSDFNSLLAFILKISWYYVVILYLILNKKNLVFDRISLISVKILYIMIIMVNLTRPFLTVFERYIQIIKLFFAIYLIYSLVNCMYKNKLSYKVVLSFYVVSMLIDLNAFRYNFLASIVDSKNILSVSIYTKDYNSTYFLKPISK